jgi:hypothetical protein
MATGPQQYQAAGQLLMMARDARTAARHGDPRRSSGPRNHPLGARPVEATLALAAATAVGGLDPDSRAWADVAGTKFSSG